MKFAFEHDSSFRMIKDWIIQFPKAQVEEDIASYDGISPLSYALRRNCPKSVELMLSYGSDPNVTTGEGVPALAWAILDTWYRLKNGTEIVRTLLSLGAQAEVIPRDMWADIMEQPAEKEPVAQDEAAITAWCTPERRRMLAKALNLTMRYLLTVRAKHGKPNQKQLDIAKRYQMQKLFAMPYHLIGQEHASKQILTHLWARLCTTEHINSGKPLVFLFCGPSRHGKTGLARNFGNLLNVKFKQLDATKWEHEWDVFGSSQGFAVHESGSGLNNFLAENTSVRSVVFIDEFCRTSKAVYNTFLEVLDTGGTTIFPTIIICSERIREGFSCNSRP